MPRPQTRFNPRYPRGSSLASTSARSVFTRTHVRSGGRHSAADARSNDASPSAAARYARTCAGEGAAESEGPALRVDAACLLVQSPQLPSARVLVKQSGSLAAGRGRPRAARRQRRPPACARLCGPHVRVPI
jgi:hypothetical protein